MSLRLRGSSYRELSVAGCTENVARPSSDGYRRAAKAQGTATGLNIGRLNCASLNLAVDSRLGAFASLRLAVSKFT